MAKSRRLSRRGRDLGDVGERAHDVVGDARPQPRRGDDDGEEHHGGEERPGAAWALARVSGLGMGMGAVFILYQGFRGRSTCMLFLLGAALMMKFWKNLTGPCGAPTYLPTYLPYLWETKKEITRWVKVGYYTN